MTARLFGRLIVTDADLRTAAATFAESLRYFSPTRVIYIETGGTRLGKHLAAALAVPCEGLDIRYPHSRRRSPIARSLLFPIKELLYRVQTPTVGDRQKRTGLTDDRIVLVDDSASSGRTLRLALSLLEKQGIPRRRIRTLVYRRGRSAAKETDLFHTDRPVHFFRRP